MDPAMGIVGGIVIARWSWGLIRDTGRVLLDYRAEGDPLPATIRRAIETEGDEVTDLHVWHLGPGHHGAILSIRTATQRTVADYRIRLAAIPTLSHVTIELDRA